MTWPIFAFFGSICTAINSCLLLLIFCLYRGLHYCLYCCNFLLRNLANSLVVWSRFGVEDMLHYFLLLLLCKCEIVDIYFWNSKSFYAIVTNCFLTLHSSASFEIPTLFQVSQNWAFHKLLTYSLINLTLKLSCNPRFQ